MHSKVRHFVDFVTGTDSRRKSETQQAEAFSLLNSHDKSERLRGALRLRKCRTYEVQFKLATLLATDPDNAVRNAASKALKDTPFPAITTFLTDVALSPVKVKSQNSVDTMRALRIQFLAARTLRARVFYLFDSPILSREANKADTQRLINALSDPNQTVARAAAHAFYRYGDTTVVGQLLNVASDDSTPLHLRASVIKSIAPIPEAPWIEERLIALYGSVQSLRLKRAAITALSGSMNWNAAYNQLGELSHPAGPELKAHIRRVMETLPEGAWLKKRGLQLEWDKTTCNTAPSGAWDDMWPSE